VSAFVNLKSERGAAKLKTIVWLLILGSTFFVGAKVAPPYFANYQLRDKMWDEARFAQANHRTEEQLRDIVYSEARSLDLPLRREDIQAEIGPQGAVIRANYTVNVDLNLYQLTLYFAPDSGRP
jgi:hypothetical protein